MSDPYEHEGSVDLLGPSGVQDHKRRGSNSREIYTAMNHRSQHLHHDQLASQHHYVSHGFGRYSFPPPPSPVSPISPSSQGLDGDRRVPSPVVLGGLMGMHPVPTTGGLHYGTQHPTHQHVDSGSNNGCGTVGVVPQMASLAAMPGSGSPEHARKSLSGGSSVSYSTGLSMQTTAATMRSQTAPSFEPATQQHLYRDHQHQQHPSNVFAPIQGQPQFRNDENDGSGSQDISSRSRPAPLPSITKLHPLLPPSRRSAAGKSQQTTSRRYLGRQSRKVTAPASPVKQIVTPARRMAHVLSEQKRRGKINDGFEELKNVIPECAENTDSRSTILRKAVDRILELEQELQKYVRLYHPEHGRNNSCI